MSTRIALHRLVLVAAVSLVAACGGGDNTSVVSGEPQALDASMACASLNGQQVPAGAIGLASNGAAVASAVIVPASATNPDGEYCLVNGQINSVDAKAQPIKFSVGLPSAWNGKSVHLGGGGWDGGVTPVTTNASFSAAPPPPLARGYAVYASDSGHADADAAFAMNDEQLQNYAGDQLKKTHDVAMALIRTRYGTLPTTSYFAGQSNGGREAMLVMQRWGKDYDGILAIFPALAWTPEFMKGQLVGRAMRNNGGAGWISQAKARAVRAAFLAACDTGDGAADGIVSNVDACGFDRHAMRCPGGADTGDSCLSDAQMSTLDLLETQNDLPYAFANGIHAAPAHRRGADWSGAIGAILTLGNTPAFNVPAGGGTPSRDEIGHLHWFADGFIRYALARDRAFDTLSFDPQAPGSMLPRLQQLSAMLDATDPNIQNFIDHGGKLILIHGQSDQLIATQPTIDYYQSVVARFGQTSTDQAIRFYLVPGYSHFGGLSFNATQGLGAFSALEDWVEKGVAPATLTATDTNPGANNRTRPLCVYPKWPRYKGSGDMNSASSFACVIN